MTPSPCGWKAFKTPGALSHARITWSLSPMVPHVSGVTLGSFLCPCCCRHSSWEGAGYIDLISKENILKIFNYVEHGRFILLDKVFQAYFDDKGDVQFVKGPTRIHVELEDNSNNPNLFGLFASGHISAQAFCGEVQPDFLSKPSISIPLAILMISMSSKGLGT